MGGSRLGPRRWGVTGPLTANLTGDEAVACFHLAVGRSIEEILSLMTPA